MIVLVQYKTNQWIACIGIFIGIHVSRPLFPPLFASARSACEHRVPACIISACARPSKLAYLVISHLANPSSSRHACSLAYPSPRNTRLRLTSSGAPEIVHAWKSNAQHKRNQVYVRGVALSRYLSIPQIDQESAARTQSKRQLARPDAYTFSHSTTTRRNCREEPWATYVSSTVVWSLEMTTFVWGPYMVPRDLIARFMILVPWIVHLAKLSPAPWRNYNASIDELSLLMTVARVPLYPLTPQLSLPPAVVRCITFVSVWHFCQYPLQ